jgi:hypothetical protein
MIHLLTTTSLSYRSKIDEAAQDATSMLKKLNLSIKVNENEDYENTSADIERGITQVTAEVKQCSIYAEAPIKAFKVSCKNGHSIFADGKYSKCRDCDFTSVCHICQCNPSGCWGFGCSIVHLARFSIDKDNQRSVRCFYWIYAFLLALTFAVWGLFFILYLIAKAIIGCLHDMYIDLDGCCACRGLVLPFFFLAVLIGTLFGFMMFGWLVYLVGIVGVFAAPFVFATIPATRDL